MRSLELSLDVSYADLHNHNRRSSSQTNCIARKNLWAELCDAISSLGRSASLHSLVLRLDLLEDDRFWWEVRETWALSAIAGPIREVTQLRLPEITVDVSQMQTFQYGATSNALQSQDVTSLDPPSHVYPLPPYMTSPRAKVNRQIPDLKDLVRYSRRRWTRMGEGDGLESRLEFFSPRDHVFPEWTASDKIMRGVFRGMLMS